METSDTPEPPIRRLPVWDTTTSAYGVLFDNPVLAVKLGLPVLVLTIGAEVAIDFFEVGAGSSVGNSLATLVFFITAIPAITAWHRLVLVGRDVPGARLHYSVQSSEWLYARKGLSILLVGIVLSFVVVGLMLISSSIWTTPMFLAIYVLVLRFSLVLPSAAIGEPMALRDSWRLTRHNTLRLAAIAILTSAPFDLAASILDGTIGRPGMLPLSASLISWIIFLSSLFVGVSFWSFSYRLLVRGKPMPTSRQSSPDPQG